ncbi:MAG: MBL fold metallo-hydrolase [Candidatus Methylarchaceae archaeon HK02M2]|nr:MBL fold metallo-hydrolase [Candidatus Methylarchaceae archaeon HK02M2]
MRVLKVHILDVGHGDTIILEMPKGKKEKIFGVIDCVKFEEKIKKYLEDLGAEKLAFVVATHPHEDHIGGIQKLLEAYENKVGEFWDSGYPHTSDTYRDLLFYLSEHDEIITEFIDSGNKVRFGKTKLNVLSPPERLLSDSKEPTNINNASIVIRVEYGDSKILLSGDAQFGNWAHMRINHWDELKAQALKVAHHGSKHGNFLEALEIVDPVYAIISAGTRDLDKFPHKFTLNSLREITSKNKIFNTRNVGNIIITSNGTNKLKVETER